MGIHDDVISHTGHHRAEIKAILNEGGRYRLALLALGLIAILELIFDHVIPYSPVGPIVVLAGSLLPLIAGVRAGRLARRLGEDGKYVGGFLYTAVVGGGVMFLFSGLLTLATASGGTRGGAVPPGSSVHLALNLSWPAAVISLASIAIGIRGYRRISKR